MTGIHEAMGRVLDEESDWISDLRRPKLWAAWVDDSFKPLGAHPDADAARVYAKAFYPEHGLIVQVGGEES